MQLSGIAVIIFNVLVICVQPKTNDKNCNNTSATSTAGDKIEEPTFVEYAEDHAVSQKDARDAARQITEEFLRDVPKWCSACNKKSIQYCYSKHLIHDHCCCDHGHVREKLPYIPHSCYIGENRCFPHLGSCSLYNELWECCCEKILAKKWKSTYSHSPRCHHRYFWMPVLALLYLFSQPIRLGL